ncbi:MAG: SDR family oxidoreductase [bacterium]|nr:SDR family oxidoreductase [bacterium]
MTQMANPQEKNEDRGGKTPRRGTDAKHTVMITGASSGFGTHLVKAFSHAGYNLVANARDEAKLAVLKSSVAKAKDLGFVGVIADIRNEKGLEELVSALAKQNVDVLINNAGVNPELQSRGRTNNTDEIQNIILTNMSSAIAMCTSAYEYFSARGGGIIININSVAGLKGNYNEAVYSASKFGLRGFSESVKDEWLKKGVRMIDVYSGAIATGMSSHRADVAGLINPSELAEFLVGLCETKSFFVRELNVQKTGDAL